MLCDIALVSRSGYYKWLQTADRPDRDYDDIKLVRQVFNDSKGKSGYRRVTMAVKSEKKMNHKKVARLMSINGLKAKVRRRNPYKSIMKRTAEHRSCENVLDRSFKQLIPFKVFCTDVTYLRCCGRFCYFSVIKDIATGEIVAWSLSLHIDMRLVFETIENLKHNAETNDWPLAEILLHSDQGFHYTNPRYIDLIRELNIIQSMSRKGNCIDNSPIESFFGHFKDEVDYKSCRSFAELKQVIEDYVTHYNNERHQWERKKMTPVEYRNHLLNK